MRLCTLVGLAAIGLVACARTSKIGGQRGDLQSAADQALHDMYRADPSLAGVVGSSHAYAIFPAVGKDGFIVEGGYGRGVVYRQNQLVGYADVRGTQVGVLAGGETIRELLVFGTEESFTELLKSQLRLGADASAVLVEPESAARTPFRNGVAVFVQPIRGVLASVAVGGQSFSFAPSGGPTRKKQP